jgi:hypothetical protein
MFGIEDLAGPASNATHPFYASFAHPPRHETGNWRESPETRGSEDAGRRPNRHGLAAIRDRIPASLRRRKPYSVLPER